MNIFKMTRQIFLESSGSLETAKTGPYPVCIDPFLKRRKLVHNGGFPKL